MKWSIPSGGSLPNWLVCWLSLWSPLSHAVFALDPTLDCSILASADRCWISLKEAQDDVDRDAQRTKLLGSSILLTQGARRALKIVNHFFEHTVLKKSPGGTTKGVAFRGVKGSGKSSALQVSTTRGLVVLTDICADVRSSREAFVW